MIKGSQRQIILITGDEASLFESAYFVLRREAEHNGAQHDDMVREANRIIEKSLPAGAARIKRRELFAGRLRNAGLFIGGSLFVGAAVAIIALIL